MGQLCPTFAECRVGRSDGFCGTVGSFTVSGEPVEPDGAFVAAKSFGLGDVAGDEFAVDRVERIGGQILPPDWLPPGFRPGFESPV